MVVASLWLHQATDLAKATSAMLFEGPESLGVMARLLVAVKPSVNRQSPGPVPLTASHWRNSRAAAAPGNDQPWLERKGGAHVLY